MSSRASVINSLAGEANIPSLQDSTRRYLDEGWMNENQKLSNFQFPFPAPGAALLKSPFLTLERALKFRERKEGAGDFNSVSTSSNLKERREG